MTFVALPLINGGHIFEDASQKKEAIYIERVFFIKQKSVADFCFLASTIFYVMHRTQSHVEKLKKLLIIIDIGYVWTVTALAKAQMLKQKRLSLWNLEMLGSET